MNNLDDLWYGNICGYKNKELTDKYNLMTSVKAKLEKKIRLSVGDNKDFEKLFKYYTDIIDKTEQICELEAFKIGFNMAFRLAAGAFSELNNE